MKNIIADISAYITSKTTLYALPLYIDMIPTESGDAVMIRANPGRPVVTPYIDGSQDGSFTFSIYARSPDSEKAYNQLCDLVELMHLADVQLTGELTITCEPTAAPSLVQKVENGDYTYVCAFTLEYYWE